MASFTGLEKFCVICGSVQCKSVSIKRFDADSYECILLQRYVHVFKYEGNLCRNCVKKLTAIDEKCALLIDSYRKTEQIQRTTSTDVNNNDIRHSDKDNVIDIELTNTVEMQSPVQHEPYCTPENKITKRAHETPLDTGISPSERINFIAFSRVMFENRLLLNSTFSRFTISSFKNSLKDFIPASFASFGASLCEHGKKKPAHPSDPDLPLRVL